MDTQIRLIVLKEIAALLRAREKIHIRLSPVHPVAIDTPLWDVLGDRYAELGGDPGEITLRRES